MIEEIKNMLGEQAKDIISQDLNLRFNGSHFTCPYPEHDDDNPSATWYPNSFHCHSCGGGHRQKQYDIFTHYELHHGMETGEAIQELCDKLGISNNSECKPSLRKSKIDQSEDYKSHSKSNTSITADVSLLKSRGISSEVAAQFFCGMTKNEFLMHGYEVVEGQWKPVYTKRRLLDGEKYSNGSKELNITGGVMCFYGMTELKEKSVVLICEGQLDALRVATELSKTEGMLDQIAVLSVPNGGKSFTNAINNSPTFRKWYKAHCKEMILIPDADKTGMGMLDQAKEFDNSDKVKWIDITKIEGVRYNDTKGADVSDVLDRFKVSASRLLKLCDFLPIKGIKSGRDIQIAKLKDGISSGFITHDYNDSGLKEGCLTVLSGRRGGGKTTLAKQIVMCAAQQGFKSFCFFGESDEKLEKSSFSRMVALDGEMDYRYNLGGRKIFEPQQIAIDRYEKEYGDKIFFHCTEKDEVIPNLFNSIMEKMHIAAKRGCYLFLIDNLMLLTKEQGSNEWAQQAMVTSELKKFALDYNIHIILVAHPKNGELKVSGSMEIEQRADTILHYVRVGEPDVNKMLNEDGIPTHEGEKVSAIILNDKVRNDGESRTIFLQWDNSRGVVMETTSNNLPQATQGISQEYYDKGWWSKPSSKYGVEDQPPKLTKGE